VRHKTGSCSYTYYAMQSLSTLFDRFEAEGTVFGSLNKRDFHNLSFLIPPTRVVEKFEQQVFPIDQLTEVMHFSGSQMLIDSFEFKATMSQVKDLSDLSPSG
jgi:hypothetical protein